MLFHHVQQKASEDEEVGRGEPGLGERRVKQAADLMSDGERGKLSDQGDKETGDIRTKEKHKEVKEDLGAQRDISRHGQGDEYVGDDLRERMAERTEEREGRYNFEQGGSNTQDEEEDEGGWFNHKQQGSSIPSKIEPEQV